MGPFRPLAGAEPDQHCPWDVVLTDHRLMPAQAAEFALDEIGVHRRGSLLEQPRSLLLVAVVLPELGQRFLGPLAGTAECCGLLGQYLMAEGVERGFGCRGA